MTAATQSHLSFAITRDQLRDRILIPKYYDPELETSNWIAHSAFDLPQLKKLLLPGHQGSRLGQWIRREHYGSGLIPYVRTSDLNGWRLRPDFKKDVSQDIFDSVAARQDIRESDILMVAHGTYLVGTVAIVTAEDLPLVLQDHVFRLRLAPNKTVDCWMLLAALSTRFVKRQIRARQFSADIIDKIGERHLEVRLPIPKEASVREQISADVKQIVEDQTRVRAELVAVLTSDMRMTRERSAAHHGFSITRAAVERRILIPKYYDPELSAELAAAEVHAGASWTTIASLIENGLIEVSTGVEVGKMAYGTGVIPFLRTTDIAELEIKSDPRQGVSQQIYDQYSAKAALREGDVLLVRDGTYLVGSSAIVSESDVPALVCGGIYKLRTKPSDSVFPYTLLALLNLPLVRRQMRAKQFTRDVIDTIGKRLYEVRVPDPFSPNSQALGVTLLDIMKKKNALRARMTSATMLGEPRIPAQLQTRPGFSMRG